VSPRVLSLITLVAACGGQVENDMSSGLTSGAGGTSNAAGAYAAGGALNSDTGGALATGGTSAPSSCVNGSVEFQIQPAPGAVRDWCIGQPGGCAGPWRLTDQASGAVPQITNNCQIDCTTCQMGTCHPTLCAAAFELAALRTVGSWDGAYYTRSTCGASGAACSTRHCAETGAYTFEICGFANPTPGDPSGCSQQTTNPGATFCASVGFAYPSTGPVVAVAPSL
jgi:hypothetical protein